MSHRNLRRLPKEEQRKEILHGKREVEDIIGRKTYGFRAPFHAINKDTVDILNEENFLYDLSGLYYRYNMRNVLEIRPTWFREWTGLYGKLRLTPGNAWCIIRFLFKLFDPLVFPVHPHYSGSDNRFASAMEDFFLFAKDHGSRFVHIPEFLKQKKLWRITTV
jgi:peptidoglycan/xylan/chitin deacetylase (PgdA/CDA1 family)